MAFSDLLRELTLDIKDSIRLLEKRLCDAEAQHLAGGERVKRQGTEIAKQRELVYQKKHETISMSEKASEARRLLDEIEKRRSELIEQLLCFQEEQSRLEKLHKEGQKATEALQAQCDKEQKSFRETDSVLERSRRELKDKQGILRKTIIGALSLHTKQQAEDLRRAFSSQEQRITDEQNYEAFKRARHTDPEIAKLCEQRDELNKFISTSMVSGVKEMLAEKIRIIEEQINKKYPQGARIPMSVQKNIEIDDLLFFCSEKGEAIILLPITHGDWEALMDGSPLMGISQILCLIWSMIKELGIKPNDGDFRLVKGFPAFSSRFKEEEMGNLKGFKVINKGIQILTYMLTGVPPEVQEVLCHED